MGAVRRLLVLAYGERGLALAYQLAGREQPHKPADRANAVSANGARSAAPVDCSAIEPGLVEAISQMPTKLQRWMLASPYDPPRWRTSLPPVGMDDGSWTG
jgi:hypothetical protein